MPSRSVQHDRSWGGEAISTPTRTAGVPRWPLLPSLFPPPPLFFCMQVTARAATAGRRRCLGLSRATKYVATKASGGIRRLCPPPLSAPSRSLSCRSSHGLRLASQSCKVCRIALPPWSARRNICRSGLALRDIRCSPYLPYGIRGPQATVRAMRPGSHHTAPTIRTAAGSVVEGRSGRGGASAQASQPRAAKSASGRSTILSQTSPAPCRGDGPGPSHSSPTRREFRTTAQGSSAPRLSSSINPTRAFGIWSRCSATLSLHERSPDQREARRAGGGKNQCRATRRVCNG